jgi:hypothetical protein
VRIYSLLVLLAWAGFPQPAPIPRSAYHTANDVLLLSYATATNLALEERAFYLGSLVDTAVAMKNGEVKDWFDELFATTVQLRPSWNKIIIQKNAVAAFSEVDAIEAMNRFALLDAPVADKDRTLDEDPRADAARTVFVRYWKSVGQKGLGRIRSQAISLGTAGGYPYAAMTSIIDEVNSNDEAVAQSIFSEAIQAFRTGDHVSSERAEFVEFLLDLHRIMPTWLLKPALEACAERLIAKSAPRKDET